MCSTKWYPVSQDDDPTAGKEESARECSEVGPWSQRFTGEAFGIVFMNPKEKTIKFSIVRYDYQLIL